MSQLANERTINGIKGKTLSFKGRHCRLLEDAAGWQMERWTDGGSRFSLRKYAVRGHVTTDVFSDIENFLGIDFEKCQVSGDETKKETYDDRRGGNQRQATHQSLS